MSTAAPATAPRTLSLDDVEATLNLIDDRFYAYGLSALLVAAGLYFTVRTRGVQLRHLGTMIRSITGSRSGAQGGISSFQAFAVGLAARVGIGNVAGVALAIVFGGPGALFWMWVVAIIGMATAFVESTLAQIFKERGRDFTFQGGPAYYIKNGLGSRAWGAVFAGLCIVSVGVTVVMVQTNSLASVINATVPEVAPWMVGVALVLLTAPIVLGGLKSVARVTEWMAPAMAILYLLLVVAIIALHPAQAAAAVGDIVAGAFSLRAGLAGAAGGITMAVLNGVRRGLFSNEAGLGGAACAAGSATVAHPTQQGFIQAFGVLVDTVLVCTATALAILIAGRIDGSVYTPGVTGLGDDSVSGTLTQNAIASVLGQWTSWPMTILIMVLAYSTILGAFSYAEVCLDYLTRTPTARWALRVAAVACAFIGGGAALKTVWTLADVLLGTGALINLVALVVLSRWARGVLRDWEAQRAEVAAGTRAADSVRFVAAGNPYLPGRLPGDVWSR